MKKMSKWVFITSIALILFSNEIYAAKVVIDPGHGGGDPGAIGVNGLYEKTVNLDISLKLQNELIKKGYQTVLTRTNDKGLSLSDRVAFKEQQQADLFVSIHANSYHTSNIKGSLVLYYDNKHPQKKYPASPAMEKLTPQSKQLAQYVLDGLVEQVHTVNKGLMANAAYVVRMGSMPSILVETAFMSNWEDIALLSSENERSKMALGIANGIERFMPPDGFKDIAGHWAYDSIIDLKDKGIIMGENNSFLPERPLTRAEFLAMMDRVFDFSGDVIEPTDQETIEVSAESDVNNHEEASTNTENTNENEYENENSIDESNVEVIVPTDLDESHWAYHVLEKALSQNHIQGYPDGTVRPNQSITRAEVSVLFDRIWKQNDSDTSLIETSFDDVPVDIWFAQAVYRLKEAQIIQGITENSFVPERQMSRAEIAVMLDRYLEQQELNTQIEQNN